MGHLDELALEVVRPTVERAGEGLGRALVETADAHAPVTALVQEGLDAAVLLAHDEDGVLADEVLDEIALLGDHRIVGQHAPCAPPHLLQLHLINGLVVEDLPVELTVLDVYEIGDVGHGNSLVWTCPLFGPVSGLLGGRPSSAKRFRPQERRQRTFLEWALKWWCSAQYIQGWATSRRMR